MDPSDYIDHRQEFVSFSFTSPVTGMGGYNPMGLVCIGDDGYGVSFYIEPNVVGKQITESQYRELCAKSSYNVNGRSAFDDRVSIPHGEYQLQGQSLGMALKSLGVTVYYYDNSD